MTNFSQWLKKQRNRDDVVGDLAKDYIESLKRLPFKQWNNEPDAICSREYLIKHDACFQALQAFDEAHTEYMAIQW